jgi:hypothetical protein
MLKRVKVKDTLTHDRIHCDAKHFTAHVQGKMLKVISESKENYLVQDAMNEQYTLSKKDVGLTVFSGKGKEASNA